jgi:hypothetical protein
MTRNTTQFIRELAQAATPVRRLPAPWVRASLWCSLALPYLALVWLVWPKAHASIPATGSFALEQVAALATAVIAAIAAFATVIPGSSKKIALAPVVPLAVWIATVATRCAHEWSGVGHLPPLLVHCACLPATLVAGGLPAIVILAMLRRGAPLMPHLTTALAALATAGIANFGIRFVHAFDSGAVVLVWHLLAVFGIALVLTALGDRIVSWRHTLAASTASTVGR